ncbi:AraC family transcriptional regulator [Bradyrhizobium sp. USDA 4341]
MSTETCKLQEKPSCSRSTDTDAASEAAAIGSWPQQPQEPRFRDPDGIRPFPQALRLTVHVGDSQLVETRQLTIAPRQLDLRSSSRCSLVSGAVESNRRRTRSLQKWRLKRVGNYIDCHMSSRITLLDLAAVAGLSRMHFASQFRAATGLRPHEFLLRERIRRAEALMQDPAMTLLEIALAVGFQTQAHFTTVFKRFSGCTPRHWRMIHQVPVQIRPAPEVVDRF